jgi:hypothetical protein
LSAFMWTVISISPKQDYAALSSLCRPFFSVNKPIIFYF